MQQFLGTCHGNEIRKRSRQGIHLTDEELKSLDDLISNAIRKGQPLDHVMAVHEDEIPVTSRTIYTYIGNSLFDIRNMDLRRQAGYRRRRKKKNESGIVNQAFRQGRSYTDFKKLMETHSDYEVSEMDTVKGKKGKGKVMLTIILRRNSVMLIFLLPDCKADSVIDRFNYLENA